MKLMKVIMKPMKLTKKLLINLMKKNWRNKMTKLEELKKAYDEAYEAYYEAREEARKTYETYEAFDEAYEAYDEARKAYEEEWEKQND